MGREFYRKYKSDPEIYNDPVKFSQWFPGLYIKNSFGSGMGDDAAIVFTS